MGESSMPMRFPHQDGDEPKSYRGRPTRRFFRDVKFHTTKSGYEWLEKASKPFPAAWGIRAIVTLLLEMQVECPPVKLEERHCNLVGNCQAYDLRSLSRANHAPRSKYLGWGIEYFKNRDLDLRQVICRLFNPKRRKRRIQ